MKMGMLPSCSASYMRKEPLPEPRGASVKVDLSISSKLRLWAASVNRYP